MDGMDIGPGGAQLLGAVALHGPKGTIAVSRPQVQLLLAYLLAERRPVTRDEVAGLLWGDRPLSPHWQGAVRGVTAKLRDHLAAAGVDGKLRASAEGTIRLTVPDGFATDVDRARAALAAARAALEGRRPDEAAAVVEPWLDHLVQPLLPATDGDWVRAAQDEVRELARAAHRVAVDALVASGRPAEGAARARTWVRHHPLDEDVQHALIAALVADGRRADALAAYDALRRVLAEELGVGPDAATTTLLGPAPVTPRPEVTPHPERPGRRGGAPPFLGRRVELEALAAAARRARDDARSGVVLVHGPSGIGKTRLVEELHGETAVWCRCTPGDGRPFEPVRSAVLGAAGRLPGAASVDAGPSADDPARARAAAFGEVADAVAQLVRVAPADAPVVLVVDDLQWATPDALDLIEDVVTAGSTPVLLVATGRQLPTVTHRALARLARVAPVTTIEVGGLEADDLVPLVEGAEEAAELHRRTGGHPFFIAEIAGASDRAGRAIDPRAVPAAVREWIGHRIDGLDRPIRARLDLAAVLGADLSLPTLAAAAGADQEEVLDALEALVSEGLLVEQGPAGGFAFTHLITQETVYRRLGPTRRARLHAAAADALAVVGAHAAAGRHHLAAGPGHEAAAATHLLAAGDEALDAGAWTLAEELLEAARGARPDDPAVQARALVGLGRSRHHQGHRDEAEDAVERALELARAHGLAAELAAAVLALVGRAGRGITTRRTDAEQEALIREALGGLAAWGPEGDPALEALACELEVELALAIYFSGTAAERAALTEAAVARARALRRPDPRLTARALLGARLAKLEPHRVAERLADADWVLALPPRSRGAEATLTALVYRHEDLLRLGRRDEARATLAEAVAAAERHGHRYWGWAAATWAGIDALVDGDLERAEALAVAAAEQAGGEAGALACLGVNLVNLRLYQGRSGEVVDLLVQASDQHPEIPCYRAVLALAAAEADVLDVAAGAYGGFRATGFEAIPDDPNRLLALAVLADTAVLLDDPGAAGPLTSLLAPYDGQHTVLCCYGGGGAYWGPVSQHLAGLARLSGDDDAARALTARARAEAAAIDAAPALARLA
jgi:DNA-binding SARP family transcriptional activator